MRVHDMGKKSTEHSSCALVPNGLLAPVIALAFLYPALLAIGILWIVTLPLSASLLTLVFGSMRSAQE
ncbi:MAG: hypothetical protein EHJ95_04100 [Methanobacteriota archaeon]|nr:MAG: hypothetical protein EHJ95_04100 [Euryarchaeota archaeon]